MCALKKNIFVFSIFFKDHLIEDCPLVECNNCGASGHLARNCQYASNQYKNSSNRGGGLHQNPENVISIDYHHLGQGNGSGSNVQKDPKNDAAAVQRPNKTMLAFFCDRLLAKKKPVNLSDEMIHTWRLAGHNQSSIFNFIEKKMPPNRDTFRLMLMKELEKVPPASIPISVYISELLDFTVDYFMPEDRVKVTDFKLTSSKTTTMPMPMPDISEHNQTLNKLSRMIDLHVGVPGSDQYKSFEERMLTMEPLQNFIVTRMKPLAPQFAIGDGYIEQTARIIIKLLAVSSFSMIIMRKHVMRNSLVSLGQLICQKTKLYEAHFPPGINPKFIISFVMDYLAEFS